MSLQSALEARGPSAVPTADSRASRVMGLTRTRASGEDALG